jgi:hypothetical protein
MGTACIPHILRILSLQDFGVARMPFSDGKNGHFSKVPGLHCRYILLARVTGLYFINVYITSLSEISDARKWVAGQTEGLENIAALDVGKITISIL